MKINKRFVTPVLAASLLFGGLGLSANAAENITQDNIAQLTLTDSKDFTIVKNLKEKEAIGVSGLTADWKKVDIQDVSKIEWTTSNPKVAKFVNGRGTVDKIAGTKDITVQMMGEGEATITATYEGKTITSNIVVEGNSLDNGYKNVTVTVDGINSEDFTVKDNVKLFSLKDIYGSTFDDADVLKKSPTAMNAILYALEKHYDPDTEATWDWDWVKDNVKIDENSEGGFIIKVAADANDWSNGWQYQFNNVKQDKASSICKITNGDTIKFEFSKWQY